MKYEEMTINDLLLMEYTQKEIDAMDKNTKLEIAGDITGEIETGALESYERETFTEEETII